ncbi:MAG: hypothetical protein RAP03_17425 [Candidatus Electryonea clarkiae]|nr:hypothetical protein [Candidatus Electryonea clarkiae]
MSLITKGTLLDAEILSHFIPRTATTLLFIGLLPFLIKASEPGATIITISIAGTSTPIILLDAWFGRNVGTG